MRRIVLSLLLLALGLPTGSLAAQQRVVLGRVPTGWIGISYEVIPSSPEAEPSDPAEAVVTEVVEDSPAREAGIQVGDTIVEIDGEPVSYDEFAALSHRLQPGLEVRFTLRRRARVREVSVEAGSRPGYVFTPGDVAIRMDTVRGLISQWLDSLRLGWVPGDTTGTVSYLSVDSAGRLVAGFRTGEEHLGEVASVRLQRDRLEHLIREGRGGVLGLAEVVPPPDFFEYEFAFPDPDEAIPFELYYLVQSEETDSLQQEIRRIRQGLARTQAQRAQRYRLMVEQARGRTEAIEEDEELQRLMEEQEALTQELREHEEALSTLSREALQRQWQQADRAVSEAMSARERAAEVEHRAREEEARRRYEAVQDLERERQNWQTQRRLITEYTTRRNFVAGAEMTNLNPDLSDYFGVREGVLVTNVVEGTPAREAGIMAGDVIVSVGERDVANLEELRLAMVRWSRPMVLRVIRKQREVEIIIRDRSPDP